MTLTEYKDYDHINMPRIGPSRVILNNTEVEVVRRVERKNIFSYTIVYVPEFETSYMIVDGSRNLRTMDSDGNPIGLSVFSYEVPKVN